jgi:hypothetical protein
MIALGYFHKVKLEFHETEGSLGQGGHREIAQGDRRHTDKRPLTGKDAFDQSDVPPAAAR